MYLSNICLIIQITLCNSIESTLKHVRPLMTAYLLFYDHCIRLSETSDDMLYCGCVNVQCVGRYVVLWMCQCPMCRTTCCIVDVSMSNVSDDMLYCGCSMSNVSDDMLYCGCVNVQCVGRYVVLWMCQCPMCRTICCIVDVSMSNVSDDMLYCGCVNVQCVGRYVVLWMCQCPMCRTTCCIVDVSMSNVSDDMLYCGCVNVQCVGRYVVLWMCQCPMCRTLLILTPEFAYCILLSIQVQIINILSCIGI